MGARIRLYIKTPLHSGQELELGEQQAHYLLNVMKLVPGDVFCGFDNLTGEYELNITAVSKRHCQVTVGKHLKDFTASPDIWLLFAPVKKDQTDFIIQKAVELGVRRLIPVITRYTISDKVKKDRFIAQSIEASEQCRRLDLPEIGDAQTLPKVLSGWDKSRPLYYMDETRCGSPVQQIFAKAPAPVAILVGPEGGFSSEELDLLRSQDYTVGVTLGPRILRAETAVAAALSCWQALSGDWTDYREDK